MSKIDQNKNETRVDKIRVTARLTLNAYDAITEIQRRHRKHTGRALPLWKIIDAAVKAYAKQQGITVDE